MPRFVSVGGVWHPADVQTKKALNMVGIETIGTPVKPEVVSDVAIPAEIEEEDTGIELTKKEKKLLKKMKKARGVKSKKVRRKIG